MLCCNFMNHKYLNLYNCCPNNSFEFTKKKKKKLIKMIYFKLYTIKNATPMYK